MSSFFNQVYRIVEQIPEGNVATYGQIARMIEQPHNARVVGWAMRQAPKGLPSHRVVMKTGETAPESLIFHGGKTQKELLKAEGVPFLGNGRINLKSCVWNY
ncbi:MGMT family protein [Alkalicoccobacillus porphyridii]|uniref:Methylated-DNA--[protein]-cysteine S-methyltransferase n=1 Tax=Alkalicoccobacillus porphyridii TaxID=2597270 RepID=A0A554A1N0_9BACI|nr:methylated-DNA--[protein]-cysteine S-methyltransferase [Alkalicoccobacillus porphyridii]TSB47593.1 methylated-DNA--[protein]-cysteine S-methyltransferase [Alkalicoccobacillus porphyridii]